MKKLFIFLTFVAWSCAEEQRSPQTEVSDHKTDVKVDHSKARVQKLTSGVTATYFNDWSNTVHTVVVEASYSSGGAGQNATATGLNDSGLDHPGEWVLVGGGTYTTNVQAGAFVINSYPWGSGNHWSSTTHDHQISDPHTTVAYAVGLRVDGVTTTDLKNAITYQVTSWSNPTSHTPSNVVTVPGGQTIVGGGAEIFPAASNFLVGTYPGWSFQWLVNSKDHNVSALASIKAYSVSMPNTLPGYSGTLQFTQQYQYSSSVPSGVYTQNQPLLSGWAPTCAGALVMGTGAGRLLMGYRPPCSSDPYNFTSVSKDHVNASTGQQYTYGLMIRKAP